MNNRLRVFLVVFVLLFFSISAFSKGKKPSWKKPKKVVSEAIKKTLSKSAYKFKILIGRKDKKKNTQVTWVGIFDKAS